MNKIIEFEIDEKDKYFQTAGTLAKDEMYSGSLTLLYIKEGNSKKTSTKILDYWKDINNDGTSDDYETNNDTHKNHNNKNICHN